MQKIRIEMPRKTSSDSTDVTESETSRSTKRARTAAPSSEVCDSAAVASTPTKAAAPVAAVPTSTPTKATAASTLLIDIDSEPKIALVPLNAAYMKKVEADVATVLEKVPELSKSSKPLTLEQGSDTSPWSADQFLTNFKARKSYRFAGNVLWIALTTPTPEVPLSEKKKNDIQTIMSKSPELLYIKVHADKDWSDKEVISRMNAGGLQVLVPVEPLHAWWGAFAVYVKDNNEEKIKEFLDLALSMPIHMVHLDSEDCSSESMNFRENLKDMGDILRVTPLMRLIHFSAWKSAYLKKQKKLQKIGSQALLDAYMEKNTTFGSRSEKLNPAWVDMANTIDSRMLTINVVREALLEAEDFPVGTNPLEGINTTISIFSH